MKSRFLFPTKFRSIGYMLFGIDILYAIIMKIVHPHGFAKELQEVQPLGMAIGNDINILTIVVGLFLIAFSKEKDEDELITQLRLDSLHWAIYFNFGIFIVSVLFLHGLQFLEVVAYNVITPFIFFITRFRWRIWRLNRSLNSETV
ncbi:hypothetical protein [Mucilaginibacter dorajii]|nr:hypothetical protein [Mucilaginibacter dorajii]MCS3734979.1 Ca2+/Na+ antiporter [Mucilaginibacter dorajii]